MTSLTDLQKALDRLVTNILRVHGLQFQKNIHGEMIQEFLVELFREKVLLNREQLSDLVKDSTEVYDELDASDAQNYILIMAGQVANNLDKLLEGSGELLNLALAFTDVKKKKGSGSDKK